MALRTRALSTEPNKGHFCYACRQFFHDSDPYIKNHKGCSSDKDLGVCVDSREFGPYHPLNLERNSKDELMEMVLHLKERIDRLEGVPSLSHKPKEKMRKRRARAGEYVVILYHENPAFIGRVTQAVEVDDERIVFKQGEVRHCDCYLADECDEWRPSV